jgi:hypothetical protein
MKMGEISRVWNMHKRDESIQNYTKKRLKKLERKRMLGIII